jgi:hypothetical protein
LLSTKKEISFCPMDLTSITNNTIKKAINKYNIEEVKEEIYGKIKGKKNFLENYDFEKYYDISKY